MSGGIVILHSGQTFNARGCLNWIIGVISLSRIMRSYIREDLRFGNITSFF